MAIESLVDSHVSRIKIADANFETEDNPFEDKKSKDSVAFMYLVIPKKLITDYNLALQQSGLPEISNLWKDLNLASKLEGAQYAGQKKELLAVLKKMKGPVVGNYEILPGPEEVIGLYVWQSKN